MLIGELLSSKSSIIWHIVTAITRYKVIRDPKMLLEYCDALLYIDSEFTLTTYSS
jgi:hypothetical protein